MIGQVRPFEEYDSRSTNGKHPWHHAFHAVVRWARAQAGKLPAAQPNPDVRYAPVPHPFLHVLSLSSFMPHN
jgi:hypothetical protein